MVVCVLVMAVVGFPNGSLFARQKCILDRHDFRYTSWQCRILAQISIAVKNRSEFAVGKFYHY